MRSKTEVLIEVREKAAKALAALPVKEPKKEGLEKSLEALKPTIEALLERGYSRAEVVDHLVKLGIPAKLYHLKALFSSARSAP